MSKLALIECKGSYYEIGWQIRLACKDVLLHSLESTLNTLANGHKATVEEVIQTASKFIPQARKFDPDYMDQIQGQADAIGVSFEKMFTLLNCLFITTTYKGYVRPLQWEEKEQ